MTEDRGGSGAPRWQLWTAFGLVYVIWGSTYLALRFAMESVPPLAMLAIRYVVAGALLYVFIRTRGTPPPPAREWGPATIVGALLLLGGSGASAWAILTVPSGITALVIAMSPLWMVVFDWARPGGTRPSLATALAVLGGLVGIALLLDAGAGASGPTVEGAAVLLVGTMAWSAGSIYARIRPPRTDGLLATAMQMLTGGVLLALASVAMGEPERIDVGSISLLSAAALAYLIVFGSLVAFTAYVWLLQHTTTAKASTYAYVNPVVALLLGWALADEPLTPRTMLAAAVIIGSVVVIQVRRRG